MGTRKVPEFFQPKRRKNDELLKGAFEENFFDFLNFVYPDAAEVLDFSRDVEFKDKELFAIIPDRERKKDKRVADLLAKLYLKDGTEKWVLLNVEIEGGNDKKFAYRLYQYHYRIRDRYNVSAATIAVFTGNKKQERPIEYKEELLGTVLSFKYISYHVLTIARKSCSTNGTLLHSLRWPAKSHSWKVKYRMRNWAKKDLRLPGRC